MQTKLVTVSLLLIELYLEEERQQQGHCENCCNCDCHFDESSKLSTEEIKSQPPKRVLDKIAEQSDFEEYGPGWLCQVQPSAPTLPEEADLQAMAFQEGQEAKSRDGACPIEQKERTVKAGSGKQLEGFWPRFVNVCENVKWKMHGWKERLSNSVGDDVWMMQGYVLFYGPNVPELLLKKARFVGHIGNRLCRLWTPIRDILQVCV